jgi:hypothetical protein
MGDPVRREGRRLVRALAVAALVVSAAGTARAQQNSGQIVGRVSNAVTEAPLAGLTVVASGPQGEEATLTDDAGEYRLSALPVGSYELKVYAVGTAAAAERSGVLVSADKTVRVNLRIAPPDQKVETYLIERRAPAVDLGTSHTGLTLGADYLANVPVGTSYGDVLDRAPGAFVDRSGSVSVAGASGLENVYLVDGLNVTGIELGEVLNGKPNASGGSNLPLAFLEEISVRSGGYAAEFGGAMGGVVNVVTKSGTNRFRASAFSLVAPSFLDADPARVARARSALVGQHARGYDFQAGAEAGGPILRNRLFFWAGIAPRRESGSFVRDVQAQIDANGDGASDLDAAGELQTQLVQSNRAAEWRQSYPYGVKLTYLPRPEHRLNLGLFGSPTSSRNAFDRTLGDAEAAADMRWPMQNLTKNNTDLYASWTGHFFDRRWQVEATAGLHDERYREKSPQGDMNELNQVEWHNTSLFEREGIEACRPEARGAGSWDPCPVDVYRTGGFGLLRSYSAQRWSTDLKSTHFLSAAGSHEVKYGARIELSVFDQTRHYSGPAGSRALVQHFPGNTSVWSLFSLPQGRYPFQFSDGAPGDLDPNMNGSPAELAGPLYKDELRARVKNVSPAFFLQDSYSPLSNLTVNLGARFEHQRLYDYQGSPFANLSNLAFRGGVIYDPSSEGRSKLFGHYGRFFEAVPLNLAARYFGGEGILIRNYDNSGCSSPPASWKGQGEFTSCPLQPQSPPASSPYGFYNNGSNYPVQPELRGQYHDEIVAGGNYEVIDGLVLGVQLVHRWLGAVLEDGTAADGTFVLANPGRVSPEALGTMRQQVASKQAQFDAAGAAEKPVLEAELGSLKSTLANLEGLAEQPKPERTYDAVTLSASQRLARRLYAQGSYTYSRLYGNYNGLYDADNNYSAPNGNNAWDTPDLVLNKTGRLANDRPHSVRLGGFYDQQVGPGGLVFGLNFSAFSGVPRNYSSALIPGQQLVFLLPRGSAGRTPMVTQLDARLAYRQALSKLATLELSVELFNLFNRRTPLRMDDNYTYDMAAAIVGGSARDLPYAKNYGGQPVTVNPNFGRPTAYQPPFHGRLGLRISY